MMEYRLIILCAKKILTFLLDYIYIGEYLTCMQIQEFTTLIKVVVESKQVVKWTTIHNYQGWIIDSPPAGWSKPFPLHHLLHPYYGH